MEPEPTDDALIKLAEQYMHEESLPLDVAAVLLGIDEARLTAIVARDPARYRPKPIELVFGNRELMKEAQRRIRRLR